jgi:hypothetical protein
VNEMRYPIGNSSIPARGHSVGSRRIIASTKQPSRTIPRRPIVRLSESAAGQSRRFCDVRVMSALPRTSDVWTSP